MSLESLQASLADRYRIERELGAGGMATVYLAQDLKHDRRVAIKVLRPDLAAVIGAERFLREIKTTATLQHPHILGLIDSGEVDGTAYYVMPFVEGESLRDRLARERQLPVADAVQIAVEVASALDYAHRHGVIHRDIKPENLLLHDGSALVADFGIALAVSSGSATRMTETGMSLGTPHYMSPEQAMGEREITARSDVYALGVITYEMLLGEPPFTGPTAQAIIAKVMTEKPAGITSRRDRVPPHVEAAVFTALEKLPADRFATAAEFAAALRDERTGAVTRATRAAPRSQRTALLVTSVIAVVATLVAVGLGIQAARRPLPPVTRLSMNLPDLRVNHVGFFGQAFALSPDGSRLAFISQPPGAVRRLMVKDRGDAASRLIDQTDGADGPFFSPDGEWIGYTARDTVYRVRVSGGPPQAVANDASELLPGGAWLPDGRILYPDRAWNLKSVRAEGGQATTILPGTVTSVAVLPTALPRSDVILLTTCGNNCARTSLISLNLKTKAIDTVMADAARGWYLPTGHLVVARSDGRVVGAPFDLDRLRFKSPPVTLLNSVLLELGVVPELAVAGDGTLIYLPGNQGGGRATVVRVGRDGAVRPIDPAWETSFTSLTLSPDGRQLAVGIPEAGSSSMWVKQLDTGPLTRLTFDGAINYRAAWLPDGRTLSYSSDREGTYTRLYRIRADGSDSRPERLLPNDTAQVDEAEWSRDGQWLVYRTGTTTGVRDIFARRLNGDSTPIPVAASPSDEYMPTLSPDSRWVAYVSVESGREEVYVRPLVNPGRARWQVSSGGGTHPRWAHSGRELFYVARGDSMTAAEVSGTPDFRVLGRRALFSTRSFVLMQFHQSWGVEPGDRSFVLLQLSGVGREEANRLTVVLNWFSELSQREASTLE